MPPMRVTTTRAALCSRSGSTSLDRCHLDFDTRLILVDGAAGRIDTEADDASDQDIASGHRLYRGDERANTVRVALLLAMHGDAVLSFSRETVAGAGGMPASPRSLLDPTMLKMLLRY